VSARFGVSARSFGGHWIRSELSLLSYMRRLLAVMALDTLGRWAATLVVMAFHFRVVPPSPGPPRLLGVPDDRDYDSLVMASCDALGETDAAFHVHGFGQSPWPVDVAYDLSTFVEQLPNLEENVRAGRPSAVDFYGQGIERKLTFEPLGLVVAVRCTSRVPWTPVPDIEIIERRRLVDLLVGVRGAFARSLLIVAPDIAALRPFSEWQWEAGHGGV
jgi:hypothetical protein